MGVQAGLIGLTHPHSAGYLRTFEALDLVDGIVLHDPDPAALARGAAEAASGSAKPRVYSPTLEELLARPDLPIVLVALPTDVAPEVAIAAARAGKQVICEKPCARSAAHFRPVLAALEAARVQFTAPYVWRAHPAMQKIRDLVSARALGQVTSFELRMVTTRVGLRDPSHWLFRREVAGGGILSWLGCHWLDLLRYLTGEEVAAVSALAGTLSGEAIDVEDVASVNLQLANGAIGSLYAGYLLPFGRAGYEGAAYDQSIILRGTRGALRYYREGEEHRVDLESSADDWRTAPRQTFGFTLPPSPAYGGAHGLAFFDDFIRFALAGTGQNLVTSEDALRVLQILDAAYESARSGRTVALDASE